MVQLDTDYNTNGVYDEAVFKNLISEINNKIKQDATLFRILIEFDSTTLEAKVYKNSIINYYLYKGFKIVNYNTFLYIDWSRPDLTRSSNEIIYSVNDLGNSFTAKDLYYALIDNDLREISYRIMLHKVSEAVKKMNYTGLSETKIHFNITSSADGLILNNLFAPDLKKINEEKITDAKLEFLTGTVLKISYPDEPVYYTEIETHILFGSRKR